MTTTDDKGMDLLGQIVSANVSAAAYTTDRLLESKDAQIRDLAQSLTALWDVLGQATVIDRKTERGIWHFEPAVLSAYRILEEMEEST